MAESPRTYGGVDGSARVAERRRALVEAGLDLLGTTEPELTVRGVCRRAGVASRYFYESFGDKNDLMEAVYDHVIGEITTTTLAAVGAAPDTEHDRVHAAVHTIVRLVAEDPRRGRLLFSATLSNDVLAAKRSESTQMFAGLLASQASEFYATDTIERLDLTTHFVVGGFAQVLTSWLGGELILEENAVVDWCTDLLLAAAPTGSRPGHSAGSTPAWSGHSAGSTPAHSGHSAGSTPAHSGHSAGSTPA
ncbi:TetR/AcrR family transcriptional regulator [Rhodococcus sp. 06-156-3C]|uniref:TetR/AcrR family transcriptional regulator n=1 Tax=Nocardiaceae TaxID=85025 RepID=UPI0003641BA6|nr:TetR/AcrR family transcriptional regulator [Rhodococcus fascians]OZD14846.1 TetR/AcrR family transcriptional regulator [Rhodococcus sp. 06-156-4C]OZD20073.1 TetR/AcrR family transcriptional regulator [Rhodococcus sp. 06-156-4a]OZD22620.1 TetR/AcrR family transcriptional regulator [Rhodococcus sp. 06-156-3C]OZD26090.1 TetR/AcrR family transcriptional regulator [Rhodococcus sp. 06-156-3b]OZD38459.1 TetR/AcrR family transcriptional regulator [Rhodococcus sp. 06-156-3]OZF59576.1 TetR/AcrR fami